MYSRKERIGRKNSRQLFPSDPARASHGISLRCLNGGAVALGVAFYLEGFLVEELNVAILLPPAAGRALLVG